MNPSEDANTAFPARVQPAAPSTIPTVSTAIPPATPAWPNQRSIFRARQAASEEATIAVAEQADEGAASSGAPATRVTACRARYDAPPSTTALAKKPSGSKRTSVERRLATNQRKANAAP